MLKNIFLTTFLLYFCGCAFLSKGTKKKIQKTSKVGESKHNPVAIIDTNKGPLVFQLFPKEAPKTVRNFISLATSNFYDSLTFHRVIKDFVVQGGDPKGDGSGGPGYSIADEISPNLKHDKIGVLAMAHRGPNTAGSQFYVTLAPAPWLDGGYTIFGQLVRGKTTLDNMASVETDHNNRPLQDIVIRDVIIRE